MFVRVLVLIRGYNFNFSQREFIRQIRVEFSDAIYFNITTFILHLCATYYILLLFLKNFSSYQ